MKRTAVIALNTVREVVRDRIFYILVFFAVLLIAVSKALGWISIDQDVKIIRDFSLAAIQLFVLLVTIFLGTNLVYKEVDKRTIYTILSKDIRRWQFVLGKYAGLWATAILCVAGMSAVFLLYLLLLGGSPDAAILLALYGIVLELAVITSLSLLLSSLTSPVLSAFLTLGLFGVGHSVDVLRRFTEELAYDSVEPLARAAYYLLPNLENFNYKTYVGSGRLPPAGDVLGATAYAAVLSAVFLALTLLVYRKRQF